MIKKYLKKVKVIFNPDDNIIDRKESVTNQKKARMLNKDFTCILPLVCPIANGFLCPVLFS